jgi:exocyst complex protein 7
MFLAYEIIEVIQPASVRLKSKTGEQREFTDALKPIRQTALSSFSFVLDDLKRAGQVMQVLPVDNTVADLTVDTMTRLRKIAEYHTPVTNLLVALGDGNWKRPYNSQSMQLSTFDVGADGSVFLSHFLLDIVDRLIHELEQKAVTLVKKKSNVAVFMVNNVAYIDTNIRRSELAKIMTSSSQGKVEKWRKDAVKMYMDGWKECAAFLMDVTHTKTQQVGKQLSGKEKEGVKDKFKVCGYSLKKFPPTFKLK